MNSNLPSMHGILRGLGTVGLSPQFEGRFGRMFRTLPPARFNEEDLKSLASVMVAEAEETETPETEADAEENTAISAGFTYLGQFIDHDLTFDPASSLQKENDPDASWTSARRGSISTASTAAAPTTSPISIRMTGCGCSSAGR